MNKQFPSMFNDVLGPVMRGPSSSHTAAFVRIGQVVRQLLAAEPVEARMEFRPESSIAATYHSQCADAGFVGGLLGMDTAAERLLESLEVARERDVRIAFVNADIDSSHPNGVRITARDVEGNSVVVEGQSIGGGMIEITGVNGFPVMMSGGFYETLFFDHEFCMGERGLEAVESEAAAECASNSCERYHADWSKIIRVLADSGMPYRIETSKRNGVRFANVKTEAPMPEELVEKIKISSGAVLVYAMVPVLPVRSQLEPQVPYITAEEILRVSEQQPLWKLGLTYECARSGLTETEAYEKMREIVRIMGESIKEGLSGTNYEDRMLHQQSHRPKQALAAGMMVGGTLMADIMSNITAVMETKSAMGRIVAAPTAGSCGCLPGTVFAVAKELHLDEDAIIRAMFAGSMVGVLIAEHATFAAEVGGCQAECGSGSGITAAAVAELLGGTAAMALDAASMALQNVFGMVCDPVAGRVEVPCLGKNIMTGANAVMSANMALAGFDKVIPLDETIEAMDKTGKMLPLELRCTGRGGLSVVPSALEIERKLK